MSKELILDKKLLLIIFLKLFLTTIVTSIVCVLFLVCSELVPKDRIYFHVKDDGNTEVVIAGGNYVNTNNLGSYINYYTDAFMMNTALCKGEGNLLKKAMSACSYDYGDSGFESLTKFLNDNDGYEVTPYARYWNGYLVVLRPLLCFFTYSQIQMLNMVIQCGILIFLIKKLMSQRKYGLLISMCISIISMNPIVMSKCLHFSFVYYILLISCSILVCVKGKMHLEKMMFFFLILGMLVSFFDLSTFPLVTLIFPLIFIESYDENSFLLERLQRIILFSFSWVCGYIGLWGLKWIYSSIALKDNIIANAVGQILFRTSDVSLDGNDVSRLDMLWENLKRFKNNWLFISIILALIVTVVLLFAKKIAIQNNKTKVIALLCISIVPIAWLAVKTNHSFIHNWMTYRELSGTLFSFLACISSMFHINKGSK